jgi:GTP-binding protein EngB required for normal cell division
MPLEMRFHPCIQRFYENLQVDPQIPRPGWETLLEAFIESSKQFDRVFVMLDAFDECGQNDKEREKIVEMIQKLDNARINVFVTAHTHSLQTLKCTKSTGVEIRAHPEDIQYYIEANLPDSVNEELKLKIVKAISEKVDGLYSLLS